MIEGYWERDNSHFPMPMSRYLWDLFLPAYDAGARRGLARYGCVLDHFEFKRFSGRLYIKSCPVRPNAVEERRQAANNALSTKLWRQDCAAWPAIGCSLRERLLAFARMNPAEMDLEDLRKHVSALRRIFVEGVIQHFVQQPASMFPVGDFIRQTCEWTGASTADVATVFQGSCRQTGDYLHSIDELVHALRDNPTAKTLLRDTSRDPRIRLAELGALSPEIGKCLTTFLDEYSDRIVTGFDITDSTVRELPQFTLALIASRSASGRKDNDLTQTVSAAEAKLRARVPASRHAQFDESLREAKAAYGLHDDDVRITYLWPLGLIRRALIAAAEKMVPQGSLDSVQDIFQATPDEAEALMAGAMHPTASELKKRAEESALWALEEAPASIGQKQTVFSDEELGPQCSRISAAILFYLGEMEAAGTRASEPSWSILVEGLAASPGRYEGRARIVCGPGDFAKLGPGDVLVARTTSPAYNVILPTIGAVVTDKGGSLCHAAIVAREFGIPAVVGTNDATAQIPDGAQILVDGDRGFVAVCL